jgi:3-hydroxybutyrate dehydrogenase
MTDKPLSGRIAIVTGSTSGIGEACARGLADAGASVLVNGFGDPRAISALCDELAAASGAKSAYSAADLSDPDQVAGLVATCLDTLGPPDILVNNAGIQHVSGIEAFPFAKWRQMHAIMLDAPFLLMQACVPHMKAKAWGRIISTASAHASVASPNKSAYVTAKHGLIGLTKTVALEVATHGITVNCISPGYVWTPLVENQIPDTMKTRNMTREQVIENVLLASTPQKQFVMPEQVSDILLFLCSESAKSITGTSIAVDGGWTAQ